MVVRARYPTFLSCKTEAVFQDRERFQDASAPTNGAFRFCPNPAATARLRTLRPTWLSRLSRQPQQREQRDRSFTRGGFHNMRTPWHLSRRRTQITRTGIRTIVARRRDPASTARAAHGGAVTGQTGLLLFHPTTRAVRHRSAGHWWRTADFGEVPPVHKVLTNGSFSGDSAIPACRPDRASLTLLRHSVLRGC